MEIIPLKISGNERLLLLDAPLEELRMEIIPGEDCDPPQAVDEPVIDILYPAEVFHFVSKFLVLSGDRHGFIRVVAERDEFDDVRLEAMYGFAVRNVRFLEEVMDFASYVDLKKKVGGKKTHLMMSATGKADHYTFSRFIVLAKGLRRFGLQTSCKDDAGITFSMGWHVHSDALNEYVHIS
ncbi:MAG TPA: hypothetical protein VJC11_01150 [Patescibacteria group bacterium]|nr:hypothetical protein [Patescibacteria group bacterium]